MILPWRNGPRPGLPEGDRTASGPGPQRRSAAIFRRRPKPGFASRNKIAAARRPPLRSGRCRCPVQARSARRQVIAVKAAMGAADPTRDITMATDRDDTDFEPPHTSSSTDHVLTELQLYGHRPFQDEPDPRPLPEANVIAGAVADIFDALIATLA